MCPADVRGWTGWNSFVAVVVKLFQELIQANKVYSYCKFEGLFFFFFTLLTKDLM